MNLIKAAAPAVLVLALATPALADGDMVLSGTGIVHAAPDMATVSTGVVTQAATAREALNANSAAMEELIGVLRGAGLEDRDIQTSNFNVSPQYVYSDQRDENGYTLPPEISGYQVSNALTISVHDLENLGAVLDQAVSVGANTVNGITFSVADPAKLLEEARRRAFTAARDKAVIMPKPGFAGEIERLSAAGRHPPRPMMRAEARHGPSPVGSRRSGRTEYSSPPPSPGRSTDAGAYPNMACAIMRRPTTRGISQTPPERFHQPMRQRHPSGASARQIRRSI